MECGVSPGFCADQIEFSKPGIRHAAEVQIVIETTFLYLFGVAIATCISHGIALWVIWRSRRFAMLIALVGMWIPAAAMYVRFMNSHTSEWSVLDTLLLDSVCFFLPNLLTIWTLASEPKKSDGESV